MRKHFVKTENYARLEQGVEMLSERGAREASWQIITGRAGEGKTTNLYNWGAANGAVFVAMHPGMSPGRLLATLASKLRVTRGDLDLDSAIGERLAMDQIPIILDEAHYGLAERAACLERLRGITDKSGTPVLLVTMETEVDRFDERQQLASRIFNWVEFAPTSAEDVARVCKSLAEVDIAADLVARIHTEAKGRMRNILNAISRVEMAAKGLGQELVGASRPRARAEDAGEGGRLPMSTIHVTAAPGCRVPQEHHPRRYYPAHGEAPMAVSPTPHIQRLIFLGDLVRCEAPADGDGAAPETLQQPAAAGAGAEEQ